MLHQVLFISFLRVNPSSQRLRRAVLVMATLPEPFFCFVLLSIYLSVYSHLSPFSTLISLTTAPGSYASVFYVPLFIYVF